MLFNIVLVLSLAIVDNKRDMAKRPSRSDSLRARRILFLDFMIGAIALCLLLGVIHFLINSRSFQLFGDIVARVETEEKVVALTLDDGPLPRTTDQILDILKDNEVKATFYLIGNEIERYPNEARRIVAEGHELGNHSYSHFPMIFTSWSFNRQDIERSDEIYRGLGYDKPTTFRPPYGDKLFQLPLYLSQQNRTTVMWDIAPDDHPEVAGSADSIVQYTLDHVRPGSIIILHPVYDHRKPSLDALEPMIKALRDQGYRFVTVSELLQYR